MPFIALAFLTGILCLQLFPSLPSLTWSLAVIAILKLKSPKLKLPLITILLGFIYSLYQAHSSASFILPPSWEGKPLQTTGIIISIPHVSPTQSSFLFQTKTIDSQPLSTLIQLSLTNNHNLHIGDEYQFPVRLKKIHSTSNPGGFDYEAWAFLNHIRAKGYVLAKESIQFIAHHPFLHPLDRLRQYIQEQAQHYLPPSKTAPWILALMIGERSGIPHEQWTVLRNTGTNHLMAIAGLHIGFMSAMAHFIARKLWSTSPRLLFLLPAQQAAAAASLMMAIVYSALAGFSIPTQRAIIMISVFLLAILQKRILPLWQAWSLALLIVLLLNPLNVLSSSFWLSFTTLALILYGVSGRLAPQGWWWKWGRPQWVITFGLLPLSLWIFTQYSLSSFIVNSIAIPWVGFLILPWCFVSILLILIYPPWSAPTLWLADKSLSMLWSILSGFSELTWAVWEQAIPHYAYVLSVLVGILILLLPAGFPARFLGLAWMLPLIFFKSPVPHYGELKFTLLDVGQGLSAVMQTQAHALVFDTGLRLGKEFDMGESVVLPYLRDQGIVKLDMLIVSHADNDHSGGAQAILNQMPVKSIRTSVPQLFLAQHPEYCLSGQSWDWDGVHFKFLAPQPGQLNQGNDSSCVLQVSTKKRKLLIAGDIEKAAEKYLIEEYKDELASDLIVAPHHGSKTSGLREFIGRVHPQYVLYAIGYRNRFHFPHPEVVQAYRDWGAIGYDTASGGAIQILLGEEEIKVLGLYRRDNKRYWND